MIVPSHNISYKKTVGNKIVEFQFQYFMLSNDLYTLIDKLDPLIQYSPDVFFAVASQIYAMRS